MSLELPTSCLYVCREAYAQLHSRCVSPCLPDFPRTGPVIAASVGSYGAYLADGSEYSGNYSLLREELKAFHKDRLDILIGAQQRMPAGVPFMLAIETIPSLEEARAMVELLLEYVSASSFLFLRKKVYVGGISPLTKSIVLVIQWLSTSLFMNVSLGSPHPSGERSTCLANLFV